MGWTLVHCMDIQHFVGFPGGTNSEEPTCQRRRHKRDGFDPSLSWEHLLEEGMATYSGIFAWRIPWTEELGGLLSIGSQSQTWLKWLSMHVCPTSCEFIYQLFFFSYFLYNKDSAVMGTHVQVCGWAYIFNFLGYVHIY